MTDVPLTAGTTNITFPFGRIGSVGVVPGEVTVAASGNTTELVNIFNTPIPGNVLPSGAVVLTGLLSYTLREVPVGGSVDVTLTLPEGAAPDGVFKIQNGQYVDISSLATIVGDSITLHLTDGGPGDEDGRANGEIIDPVIPVRWTTPTSAPTAVWADSGYRSAAVNMGSPVKNGGTAPTGWVITPYLDGVALPSQTFNSGASPQVVTGLINGRDYQFKIAAINPKGRGPFSGLTAPVRVGAPAAPSTVTASPGTQNALVSWSLPANNGSPITGYVVTPYSGATALSPRTFNDAARSKYISGLTPGRTHTFRVAAVNAIGTGARSLASNAATVGAPTAPTGVAASPRATAAVVTWTAPSSNNGSAIIDYTIARYRGVVAEASEVVAAPATSRTVSGLVPGVTYTFVVSARNALGSSPRSAASNAATVGAPTAPTVVVGRSDTTTSAVVTWVASSSNGSAITGYRVIPYRGTTALTPRVVTGTATTRRVTGLVAGATYTFRVEALNKWGTSPLSQRSAALAVGLPTAPTIGAMSAGNTQVTVSWAAPSSNGGSPVTGYQVTPYIGSAPQTARTFTTTATTQIITGLANGTAYTFRVRAINSIGVGSSSSASASATPRP